MENSNETNHEMTNVKLDEEQGVPTTTLLKKKQSEVTAETAASETEAETPAQPVAVEISNAPYDEGITSEISGFGKSLMNFCTLGAFSSNDSTCAASLPEEQIQEQPMSADMIVEDLAVSEAQITQIDEETAISSKVSTKVSSKFDPQQSRQHSLIAPVAPTDEDASSYADSKSAKDSIISRIVQKKNKNSVLVYTLGISIFFTMVGFFIAGGILLRRNGW